MPTPPRAHRPGRYGWSRACSGAPAGAVATFAVDPSPGEASPWIPGAQRTLGGFPTGHRGMRAGIRHGGASPAVPRRAGRSGGPGPDPRSTSQERPPLPPPAECPPGPAARLCSRHGSQRHRRVPQCACSPDAPGDAPARGVPNSPGRARPTPRPCRCRRRDAASRRRPPSGCVRNAAASASAQSTTLALQRDHAVVGEHAAVAVLGRHEIPLGLLRAVPRSRPPAPPAPAAPRARRRRRASRRCRRAGGGRCRAPARRPPARRRRDGGGPGAPPSAGRGRAARRGRRDSAGGRPRWPAPPACVVDVESAVRHAAILPRCRYGDAPCPGPLHHAAPGPRR